ncbi:helix-turn-helix transcriptional regulator [Roseospirillum parvum]|uniref:DNA-binding transcriptional regulator, CsgD family n=1 Tax=Roseospirillum parvum TaxID=83401 RepID=A0A1G8FA87_9PROT|nr:LuxR C-terminal-related transcriptional regulator [Roseospirillum parvum]SDH79074.1 DNA-binding transcriptional regulator, CsgD family [Roseospirillum parvum]
MRSRRLTDQEEFDTALDRLYEAIRDRVPRSTLLEDIRVRMGARGAVLFETTPDGRAMALASAGCGSELPLEARVENLRQQVAEGSRRRPCPPGCLGVNGLACQAHFSLTRLIDGDPARQRWITFARPVSAGDFEARQVVMIDALMPHLRRYMRLFQEVGEEETPDLGVLDALAIGAMVVQDCGAIRQINDSAASLLGPQADWHGPRKPKLENLVNGQRPVLRGWLQELFREPGRRTPFTIGGHARRGGPLTLLPAPILGHGVDSRRQRAATILVYQGELTGQPTHPAQLARHFGLTPTENRLVENLTSGLSLTAAAKEMGISYETARSHLKRVFAKTETGRQAELVRLCLSVCAGQPGISRHAG